MVAREGFEPPDHPVMSGLLYLAELSRHCPLELRRHELGKRDSDAHLKASKTCGMPVTPFPTKSRVQVPNPPTCCGRSVWSLWTASNRLLPRTKGTLCQMSYRGASCPPWPRTRNLRNQNPALCRFELMGIGCGRCDSNAHAARFELARSTGCHHSRMVRREGLEPPAIGLRVHCSSI